MASPASPAGQPAPQLDARVADGTAQSFTRHAHCDEALTRLFTPAFPVLGSYEVCTTATPLRELLPEGWFTANAAPVDAFGEAGAYDRARLARLYGGRRVLLGRGHLSYPDRLESITLISPYPDASFRQLHPGTLIIVHRVPGV